MKQTFGALLAAAVGLAGVLAYAPADARSLPVASPPPLPFYPQAGVLGEDLYVTNFVDLQDGPGVRDFACGAHAYDGHTGIDTIIRSFREQVIGVPVFAALDGRVVSVQTGSWDYSHGTRTSPFDNHVVLRHEGLHETVYGHLAHKSIRLRVGDRVRAGQQIGLTASSGNSSWPHLHFTVRDEGTPYEPFAGPCRDGGSGWSAQPPFATELRLARTPSGGSAELPWDEAVRTGTFVRGVRDVHFRVEARNVEHAAQVRVRFVRPDGSVAFERARPARFTGRRAGWSSERYRLRLNVLGTWRLEYHVDDVPFAIAPFRVVALPKQVVNRRPRQVGVELQPPEPRADEVVFCRVRTSLLAEDPDYDIVRYRYRWTVDGRVVRSVVSAALTDALPRATASPGATVGCAVTPGDGRLVGPTATTRGVAR